MAIVQRGVKQQDIEAYILERIRDGRLKPGAKTPSDQELARRFGVSTVTATKVLTSLAARGVVERRRGAAGTVVTSRLGSMGTVGFVMLRYTISHYWDIFCGAADILTARGYRIHFLNPNLSLANGSMWQSIAESGMIGLISVQLIPPMPIPMPAVLVDYATSDACPCPTVDCDDEGGGYQMGRHLMEAGHREVVFLSFPKEVITATRRAEGFMRALREYGVKNTHRRVYYIASQTDSPSLVHRARRDYPKLTAIATASDPMAAAVIRALIREKVRVPADISVAGFGNLEGMFTPLRVTTIDAHPMQLGSQAASLLLDWTAQPERRPDSVVVPCTLVPGDTVAVLQGH